MPHTDRSSLNYLKDVIARMPWWGGLLLAFVGYVMFHPFAIMDTSQADPVAEALLFDAKSFVKQIASLVQYVVPLLLALTPLVSSLLGRLRKGSGA